MIQEIGTDDTPAQDGVFFGLVVKSNNFKSRYQNEIRMQPAALCGRWWVPSVENISFY